jgi:DNA-binding beta-propeller fold protein YncE
MSPLTPATPPFSAFPKTGWSFSRVLPAAGDNSFMNGVGYVVIRGTSDLRYLVMLALVLAVTAVPMSVGTIANPAQNATPLSGWAPSGLAITQDGKKAYVSFSLDDSLLVVNLTTFTITESIDVSAAGTMLLSGSAALFANDSKLAVANPGTKNVMIVDTKNDCIEAVLPIGPCYGACISVSHDGNRVYIENGSDLYIINGSDDSYRRISIPGVCFERVEPSAIDSSLLYCIGRFPFPQPAFFAFNLSSNTVQRLSNLTDEANPPGALTRFTIDSNETKAYFGTIQFNGDKGFGNLHVFDLKSYQTLSSTSIECGVTDFAINEEKGKIYIIGFWSGGGAPNTGYIREWDMSTNNVVRNIFVSPSSDQRAIAVDPTNSDYLYMTEGDRNFIRKVEISSGREVQRLKFSKDSVAPYALIRGNGIGYIACQGSRDIFKLNLSSGQLIGSIPLPSDAQPAGGYYQGKLYFAGWRSIYSINPADGSLIQTFNAQTGSVLKLTFFNDRMATITYSNNMIGNRLLLFDAENMTLLKSVYLPEEQHGNRVVASPDGSKLYVERGPMGGPTIITIFNSSTLDIINTIEIPATERRCGATGFLGCDFDEENRILYLCGFTSIYKINMDNDRLVGTLDLIDLYESLNIDGWSCTGLAGAVLSLTKDKLYVISGDAHSMFTYNLVTSSWIPQIINLRGYFITDAGASPDRKYIYTINQESDSITMVDLTSLEISKIIELAAPDVPKFPLIDLLLLLMITASLIAGIGGLYKKRLSRQKSRIHHDDSKSKQD